jgi:pimeloyl-ACP methyl ester carboxylesterase
VAIETDVPTRKERSMITPRGAKADFIVVDGVRLQTLDWGGSGPALVFLAGYANTPHFFDPLARAFADRFRVLGLTRRAHGASDQPETGYDVPTLAKDVVGLLDALGFESASFVGHSFAGHELCCLAMDHPRRVEKLVFLDTLYDYTDEDRELLAANPLPPSDPAPETFESVAAYCADFVARYAAYRRLRSPHWDALWAHSLEETPGGRYRERIRPETATKLFEGVSAFRPEYTAIQSPVLAFFAFQDEHWSLPEDAPDELCRAMKRHIEQVNARIKRRCIDRVRREIADARIVEFADTSHYCFLDRQADVIAAMRDFL